MTAFPSPTLAEAYNPEPQREYMRGMLALCLVVLVGIEVSFALYTANIGIDLDKFREILTVMFTSTTTLLGTALGFYFGEKSARRVGAEN